MQIFASFLLIYSLPYHFSVVKNRPLPYLPKNQPIPIPPQSDKLTPLLRFGCSPMCTAHHVYLRRSFPGNHWLWSTWEKTICMIDSIVHFAKRSKAFFFAFKQSIFPKNLVEVYTLPRVLLDAGWVVRVQRQGEAPHEALNPDHAGEGQEAAEAHVEISIGCFVGNAVGDCLLSCSLYTACAPPPSPYVQSGRRRVFSLMVWTVPLIAQRESR